MATVALKDVFLYDRWPGTPNFNLGRPTNGFDSTVAGSGNNVDTALYPPGTKIQVHTTAADTTRWPGQSTFIYLQFHEGTDLAYDIGDPSTGYCLCSRYDSTNSADGSIAGPYQVTTDLTNSDGTKGGAIAFACTDLSGTDTGAGEWGWFWCGGVCPVVDVTRLAGDIKTGGSVAVGTPVSVVDDGSNAGALELCEVTLLCGTLMMSINYLLQGAAVGYSLQVDA